MLIICAAVCRIPRNQQRILLIFVIDSLSPEGFSRKQTGIFLIIHIVYRMVKPVCVIDADKFSLDLFAKKQGNIWL